jgi:bifunctional non-homologous end joining protein LigD
MAPECTGPVGQRAMFWPNSSISNALTAMLVEHAANLPSGSGWEYEYSWPGERVLAVKDGASVRLTSALHRRDLTNRFPVVAAAVAKLKVASAVLDGVVRAIEPAQWPLFASEAEPAPSGGGSIRMIATDLLWVDALDLRQLPLGLRREKLREMVDGTAILLTPTLDGATCDMLSAAPEIGADGVVAKRRESRYRPFARAGDWIRVVHEPSSPPKAVPTPPRSLLPFGRRGAPFEPGWGSVAT